MRPLTAALIAALTALAACSLGPAEPVAEKRTEQQRLGNACQLRKCRCVEPGASPFSTAQHHPVQWRDDGSAYCAAGQRLEVAPTGPALLRMF